MTDSTTQLRQLLGTLPHGVEALPDSSRQQLLEQILTARRLQQAELNTALEKALGHIPFLLRGPVRKVLGL